jgi:hypothetical protein
VHAGDVYIQDGPVLSRWDLVLGNCQAAINLLNPKLAWQSGGVAVDWARLHMLNAVQRGHQLRLQGARRKVEWLTLLESSEALQRDASTARTPDEETKLRTMIAELGQLVGANRSQLRAELATAEQASAPVIFSAPVVRKHQLGAKLGALAYVIGRDGTLHPLDDALQHMGTVRLDTTARPALALVEWETDAHSDDFACRLYYVTGDGVVRAVDGNSLPPKAAGEWPARGRASLQPGVRPRVDSRLLWGSDAQESGVFALPIDQPGGASRIKVPLAEEWRWLELPKAGSLALVCTDSRSRLISFASGAVTVERWGGRPANAPYYSSFLETDGRPLLVVEVEREQQGQNAGPVFRVLVANTVDAPNRQSEQWYPPPPDTITTGTLDAFKVGASAPVNIRTQVTVSLMDAYLVARDRTGRDQLRALLQDGTGSWRAHFEKVVQPYADVPAASAAIGELPLPPMAGADALYCYAVGSTLTNEHVAAARAALERTREFLTPIVMRIVETVHRTRRGRGPSPTVIDGPDPLRGTQVTLRFSNGESLGVTTNANGDVVIPPTKLGLTVTMDDVPRTDGYAMIASCKLEKKSGNELAIVAWGSY